jgi:drug/metabolite transporter (DMT)-like permease
MGVMCLVNASRCGRIHCLFTGPFFILGAVASLGYGLGLLPLGPSGWQWIGAITIIGGIALTCIPERVLGRYRQ